MFNVRGGSTGQDFIGKDIIIMEKGFGVLVELFRRVKVALENRVIEWRVVKITEGRFMAQEINYTIHR